MSKTNDETIPCAYISFYDCSDDDENNSAVLRKQLSAERRAQIGLIANFFNNRLRILVGDITKQDTYAIVNFANSSLMGNCGIDGTINEEGGPLLTDTSTARRNATYTNAISTGEVVVTNGENVFAKFTIHTIPPIYGEHNDQEEQLAVAFYQNSLKIAKENKIHQIAFPWVSIDGSGYFPTDAAKVVFKIFNDFFENDPSYYEVRLVFSRQEDAENFIKETKILYYSKHHN